MAEKLSSDERSRVAEKLMELGNLIVGALVVGQILTDRRNVLAAIGGVIVFLGLYFVAIQIMKRR
jgi:hypothetical protein